MAKQIRPLAAFKKAYPKYYNLMLKEGLFITSKSAKGKENDAYWSYCYYTATTEATENDPFFFKDGKPSPGHRVNVGTISELGRILMTGWYYGGDAVDFSKEIYKYVYNSYNKKVENGIIFNDLEFKDATKLIRDDFGYYYHNRDELKMYILETFFADDVKPMLPEKPKELQEHDDYMKRFSKGVDPQMHEAVLNYVKYLRWEMKEAGLEPIKPKVYIKARNNVIDEYNEKVEKLQQEYNKVKSSKLLNVKFTIDD